MGKPEPIQSILPLVLGGLQGPQNQVERTWRRLAGRRAAKTRIAFCRKGKLVISVDNASLLYDLSLQKETFLQGFEKSLGKGVVQEIQLRIGEV